MSYEIEAKGDVESGRPDSGKPVKIGGVGRTTNPTPVEDKDRVSASYDDVGRQLVVPHQVRDLVATAYVQITSGTPVTLLAGDADFFHDLVEVSFATNSTVAVTNVALKDDGTTVRVVDIPVNDTVTLKFPVPVPQNAKGGNWTIDMEDVTGTTLDVGALFIKNV